MAPHLSGRPRCARTDAELTKESRRGAAPQPPPVWRHAQFLRPLCPRLVPRSVSGNGDRCDGSTASFSEQSRGSREDGGLEGQKAELRRLRHKVEQIERRLMPRRLQAEVKRLLEEVNDQQQELLQVQAGISSLLMDETMDGSIMDKTKAPSSHDDLLLGEGFTQNLGIQRLPQRIILVRHAESQGNVDERIYTETPDWKVPLSEKGEAQALEAGLKIREMLEEAHGEDFAISVLCSPYKRCVQTTEGILRAFPREKVLRLRQEVQLREQDFGNFQDTESVRRDKEERLQYGRYFYRFPQGESGADVYNRMVMVEEDLVKDIMNGGYDSSTSIVIVSHGLSIRILLMNWFQWTVDECNAVWNPPNAHPLVLERIDTTNELGMHGADGTNLSWMQVKAMYRVSRESLQVLRGCTDVMSIMSLLPKTSSTLHDG